MQAGRYSRKYWKGFRVEKYAAGGFLASLGAPSGRDYARKDLSGVWNLIIGVRLTESLKIDPSSYF